MNERKQWALIVGFICAIMLVGYLFVQATKPICPDFSKATWVWRGGWYCTVQPLKE